MNFQKLVTDNGSVYYDYVRIGGWKRGNLTMDDSKIYWPSRAAASWAPMVESVCSKPCPKGQVKVGGAAVRKHCFTARCRHIVAW